MTTQPMTKSQEKAPSVMHDPKNPPRKKGSGESEYAKGLDGDIASATTLKFFGEHNLAKELIRYSKEFNSTFSLDVPLNVRYDGIHKQPANLAPSDAALLRNNQAACMVTQEAAWVACEAFDHVDYEMQQYWNKDNNALFQVSQAMRRIKAERIHDHARAVKALVEVMWDIVSRYQEKWSIENEYCDDSDCCKEVST